MYLLSYNSPVLNYMSLKWSTVSRILYLLLGWRPRTELSHLLVYWYIDYWLRLTLHLRKKVRHRHSRIRHQFHMNNYTPWWRLMVQCWQWSLKDPLWFGLNAWEFSLYHHIYRFDHTGQFINFFEYRIKVLYVAKNILLIKIDTTTGLDLIE